ncbi:Cfr family 23S rRNA (adenine(2503)-C(8))-methyltransferase [Paenibacillus alvei]|uniref:Cfr family 23S rRNA (adenine(2503)-C(8))-methyltransferase n=1 Tax=Paenibacillus alvei TaxID=44250 RepID=UPI0018CFB2D5|nr:Cfr family 23S rRNA (adenine(2503)-C(8))-methyltransferase [Paenibacillus alvei]MBG9737013.1 chloramphenicol/florfenicol resistance protein [Paenibacillus alvei]MBG9747694.1 chloramphenicol/florfenicol resistance protein [Paenibacillus alvei]MCY9582887.1 Cfr family 23S rRNA (adenine(2503)-C(8))-methyltransferase [Paenibacillus alvei]MCY9587882.1 Cfr family 23S rRNA (adenine(2503)-C(8))-methyltransferase [Paenibacillus alvei]
MKPTSKYETIRQILSDFKQPAYRYGQIIDAIFKQKIAEYERITILPAFLREELARTLGPNVSSVIPVKELTSQQVSKVLFAIGGGERVEAVRLSYKRGWKSYCISTQCGCGFGCRFCATGTIGLKRNLTADEITDQLLHFHLNGHALDSVSFMGMGEALANPHLFEALAILTNPHLFGLGHRRITISTIGLLPGIERLTREFPQVNLTFSLHSPFDEQRNELMPINKQFPLRDVLNALDRHIQHTGRKVYIAYILLQGFNDSTEHAIALAALLRGRGCWEHLYHVNLIPYNSTDVTPQRYLPSGPERINTFVRTLKISGVNVTIRTQFGADINAACGQLYRADSKMNG